MRDPVERASQDISGAKPNPEKDVQAGPLRTRTEAKHNMLTDLVTLMFSRKTSSSYKVIPLDWFDGLYTETHVNLSCGEKNNYGC
ncbi:hypothetical protein P7K49_036282 [Saguinus oedipus]|uniref:Uncharacterized protein n=1 Tax=Saguinus oedipus TaxID=9490 RepID=A0ABQ9TLC9_SAGOE|nr:hypothetical protein P7K49_036282 [Saguinus oedipus]